MAAAANPAVLAERDEASQLDLEQETGAAVLVAPESAEILAANAAGGAALGLFSYASFPVALDPAMPAIARLRQIATTGDGGRSDFETLLFWKSGRLRRVKCKVARWGAKSSKILMLRIDSVEAPDDPLLQKRSAAAAPEVPAAAPAVAKPLAGLDADTIAKLAHELKTPLTAIAAASEIMRDERLGKMKNARYLSYAADIHESATHALDVISSLLSDRAKPGAQPSRLIALDLNAIAERTVSSVKALAESCGLNLSFDTDGSTPHVVASPTGLRQILLNLLTNAIKFTPRGGDVRVATGHLDDGRVFVTVRDTGCGMSGSNATAKAVAATEQQPVWARSHGIGLPLVETLVRDMGAEIEIDSTLQKGTAATIIFGDFSRRFK